MNYWKHQIKDGDRIDLLADYYYNDGKQIEGIFQANPHLPFKNELQEFIGQEIYIPVENIQTIKIDNNKKGIKRLLWKK